MLFAVNKMIQYTLAKIAEITDGSLIGEGSVTINGVQFDSRTAQKGQMFVPIKGERVDGHSFVASLFEKGIAASLWQKDDTLEKPEGNLIVVDDVLTALQKLAAAYRKDLKCHFIGITGSSGKTSTKDIVASVVASGYRTYKTLGNQNNDIGVPVTILNMPEEVEYAVCEMGINDFGVMDRLVEIVKPEITVITSIGPAHIAQLRSIDNIVEQKCLINKYLADGQCFYNAESYGLEKHLDKMNLTNKAVGYGFEKGEMRADDIHINDSGTTFTYNGTLYSIPVLGSHQVLNALAAIGIGHYIGLTDRQIEEGLASVQLTPHRLQLKKIKEATIIDDTYNCNPSSLAASLEMVQQYNQNYCKIVVLGDMLELGPTSRELHASVAEKIDFSTFDHIYLVGEEMKALADALNNKGIENHHYDTNEEVIEQLKPYLQKNHIIFFKASNGMKFAKMIESLEEQG